MPSGFDFNEKSACGSDSFEGKKKKEEPNVQLKQCIN